MVNEFTLSVMLDAVPHQVYAAWMSSRGHTRMTGSPAVIEDQTGTEFTAWDGYIRGRNLELVKDEKIVQSWRTTDFAPDQEDSLVQITLEACDDSTLLTLHHSHLPEDCQQYEIGWLEYYFEPMKDYFAVD